MGECSEHSGCRLSIVSTVLGCGLTAIMWKFRRTGTLIKPDKHPTTAEPPDSKRAIEVNRYRKPIEVSNPLVEPDWNPPPPY